MEHSKYLGFDLSTQQLKAVVVDANLKVLIEEKVDFDFDLPHHGTQNGVLKKEAEGEIFAPVIMWLEAVDLLFERLNKAGLNFSEIDGVSGAGMQHGTVFWNDQANQLLKTLNKDKPLAVQLVDAFSHEFSPNWQDQSTQIECEAFDEILGSPEELAKVTGSKAHHRFSGPQIMKFRKRFPDRFNGTSHISLVSSFLASVMLGRVASIDRADLCGMNLWDILNKDWSSSVLTLAAGEEDSSLELAKKLGEVDLDPHSTIGLISTYFVERYGFSPNCRILPFTGDNPATLLALPLQERDAIVSLGTSTTFLMSTSVYKPSPAYHVMNHPATEGLYMFMLCYKNGSLARERIRDQINKSRTESNEDPWAEFNRLALNTSRGDTKIGLYFPLPEIVPAAPAGIWRSIVSNGSLKVLPDPPSKDIWSVPNDDARCILESQFLSMRARSASQLSNTEQEGSRNSSETIIGRPRRIFLAGGAAINPAIASMSRDILGPTDGVYRLSLGANACALGAAYKAAWGCSLHSGSPRLSFQDYVAQHWNEKDFIVKIADAPTHDVWERYGTFLNDFAMLEDIAIRS